MAYGQHASEMLSALKGWVNQQGLDFATKLDPVITERVAEGACAHLGPTGLFKLGCDDTTVNPMPIFLLQASDSPDVKVDTPSPATVVGGYVPISPTGVLNGLVATGGYEVCTTNFVDGSYAVNSKLTSDVGTDPVTGDAGQLKAGVLGTDVICGVVSRGLADNGYGYTALHFWPVFLPVYP